MFQALFDLNIIYKSKYFDVLHVEHSFYLPVIKEYIDEIKSSMTTRDKVGYQLFVRAKGITLGTKRSGFPTHRLYQHTNRGRWIWLKEDYGFEFAELYYEIESQQKD